MIDLLDAVPREVLCVYGNDLLKAGTIYTLRHAGFYGFDGDLAILEEFPGIKFGAWRFKEVRVYNNKKGGAQDE